MHPDPSKPHLVSTSEIEYPYPDDQADNPVLLQDRFAVVRLENTTDRAIDVYLHSISLLEDDESVMEMERAIVKMRAFKTERAREHALKLVETSRYSHPAQGAFHVHAELQDSYGELHRVSDRYMAGCVQISNVPPSAEELRSGRFPKRTLGMGESIEFPLQIFEVLPSRERGLKADAYTVTATVSYAVAPSGGTKRITTAPVVVTVTEDHIKKAEAYWATTKE
jgi:hypothetical protein